LSREDWYRNTDWNEEIAEAYFAKLKRARSKDQYLRIQANYLASSHPEVALELLEQFFALNDPFDYAQAYCDKAKAYIAQGNTEEAIKAYQSALEQESTKKGVLTEAYIALPMLIAEHELKDQYRYGVELLKNNIDRLTFPVDHFRFHSALAIFEKGLGNMEEASKQAGLALDAAHIKKSGFRFHQKLGLVGKKYADIVGKLKKIYA
jgi:tetratricopeptide (TPR) repeat protein